MNDFEKALIGHCNRFPENTPLILDGLNEEDFPSPKARAFYKSIRSLHKNKNPIDPISLSNQLKIEGWEIPISEIITLEDFAIEGMDIDFYKRKIKTSSQRRKLHNFLSNAIKDIDNPSIEFNELEERIGGGIIHLLNRNEIIEANLLKPTESFYNEVTSLFDGKIKTGVNTGLKTFDELIGGLRPNELSILTGETASGKTTLGAHLMYRLAKRGHPVLIASFEMKPVSIIRKMLQSESGRSLSSHTIETLSPHLKSLSSLPIFFINAYGEMGLSQLKRLIYYAKRICGIEFVLLDHLHFFLRYQGDQERQAIDQSLKDLKSWAMDLSMHILLIVHPTKLTYDNKVVHLNDLKGSSGLKQIPDNVLSIWRSREGNDLKNPVNEILLYVLKVRDDEGDEGKAILTFNKQSQSYQDSGHGGRSPSEERMDPEPSSPRSRTLSGRDWASGYGS